MLNPTLKRFWIFSLNAVIAGSTACATATEVALELGGDVAEGFTSELVGSANGWGTAWQSRGTGVGTTTRAVELKQLDCSSSSPFTDALTGPALAQPRTYMKTLDGSATADAVASLPTVSVGEQSGAVAIVRTSAGNSARLLVRMSDGGATLSEISVFNAEGAVLAYSAGPVALAPRSAIDLDPAGGDSTAHDLLFGPDEAGNPALAAAAVAQLSLPSEALCASNQGE